MKTKQKYIIFFLQVILFITGIIFAAKPVYHFIKREYLSYKAEERWKKALAAKPGVGEEHSWLSVPSADIDILVLNSDKKEDLYDFPIIKEVGKDLKVIIAHRDIHFRNLQEAEKGGIIHLEGLDRQIRSYRIVDSEILEPDEVKKRLISKSDEEWLVLMTCYPFKYIGPAPKRYLVWCRKSKADIATSFRPNARLCAPKVARLSVCLEKREEAKQAQLLAIKH